MFKQLLTLSTLSIVVASAAFANETPIVGNVSSKCSIYTDKAGVYGNPTPDELSTLPVDGGVLPVVRYDVYPRSRNTSFKNERAHKQRRKGCRIFIKP